MRQSFKTLLLLTLFSCFAALTSNAQMSKDHTINASIGLGISSTFEDYDISGSGFYLQGEYVFGISSWLDLRPYLGFISTSKNNNSTDEALKEFEVTTKALLLGGKARVLAPIPWVAPYVEIGLGATLGNLRTFTPGTDIEKKGLSLHIPFTLGLAIGRKHNFELEFTYYISPSAEQFSGAAAIGFSIPLK